MAAILEDPARAGIPANEVAMLAFVRKVTLEPAKIVQADADAVLAAGWPEEAVHDAINVSSLFAFYNRWNDAHGTPDMPPQAYAMSGKRLAEGGYK